MKKALNFLRTVHQSGHATGLIIPPIYPLGYLIGAGLAAVVVGTLGIVEGFDEEG